MYGDVMSAWEQVLTVIENLVSGVAQSVVLSSKVEPRDCNIGVSICWAKYYD